MTKGPLSRILEQRCLFVQFVDGVALWKPIEVPLSLTALLFLIGPDQPSLSCMDLLGGNINWTTTSPALSPNACVTFT